MQHVQIPNTCNKIKNQYYPIEYNKNEICQGKLKKRNNKVLPRVPQMSVNLVKLAIKCFSVSCFHFRE